MCRLKTKVKDHGRMYLKTVKTHIHENQTLLLFFDGGSLYLAKLLFMVCRQQQRFELTNMTLSKLQMFDILKPFLGLETHSPFIFDGGYA